MASNVIYAELVIFGGLLRTPGRPADYLGASSLVTYAEVSPMVNINDLALRGVIYDEIRHL
jgi:hypothetical protein